MATDNRGNGDENSPKDRATVALVDAKVDGLKDLLRAEFAHVRDDIRPIASLVLDVALLRAGQENHGRRIDDLEKAGAGKDHERRIKQLEANHRGDKDWRRDRLPALVIAATLALGSIVAAITQIH